MSTGALSAALVMADKTLREETLACIDKLPVRVVADQRTLDDVDELIDRVECFRTDVILLEGSLLKTPLEDFALRLKHTASEPAIFIVESTAVAENILEAMRAGAREYICPPLELPLKEAFERLSEVRAAQVTSQQKKLGRIFGFLSAKGGCGATTFASHVATMAAKETDRRVLLADLDFEAGLLRFILKAKPRYSMRDALDNMHRMDSSYWNALVTRSGDRLDFIAAPEELNERALPDPRQVGRLLRFLRAIYPVTILDFGRCFSTVALESIPELDAMFLVTTTELAALENTENFIQTAGDRGKNPDRIQVLINKASARQKPDLDSLEKFLGPRPAGVYSDEADALYEVWSEGRLLGADSALGRQFAALAKSLVNPETVQAAGRTTEKTAGGKSAEARAEAATNSGAMGLGRFLSFMRSGTRGSQA